MNDRYITFRNSLLPLMLIFLDAVCALSASLISLINKSIYNDILSVGAISEKIFYGSQAQDIVTIFFSILIITVLIMYMISRNSKYFIFAVGMAGYFLYAYGIYTIEGFYTKIYLLYLVIFSLSIYSLVFSLIRFNYNQLTSYKLSLLFKIGVSSLLIIIIIILGPAWIMEVLKNIKNRTHGEVYSVLIQDLAIVFPAFIITVIIIVRDNQVSKILSGIMLIKVFTICLSWGFAEIYVPSNTGAKINPFFLTISGLFTFLSLLFIVFYYKILSKNERIDEI